MFTTVQHVKQFLTEIERAEASTHKREAIRKLHLTPQEWENAETLDLVLKVGSSLPEMLMTDMLQIPDLAQHAFSAEKHSTLYNGVPALSCLQLGWQQLRGDNKFFDFRDSIEAGLLKLTQYVEDIKFEMGHDAYWMTMGKLSCVSVFLLSICSSPPPLQARVGILALLAINWPGERDPPSFRRQGLLHLDGLRRSHSTVS